MPPWLEANRSRRFFAYLHYREPHWPYDPEPPFNTMFGPDAPIPRDLRNEVGFFVAVNNRRRETTRDEAEHIVRLYDGNLAFVDQELGFLRRTLEAHLFDFEGDLYGEWVRLEWVERLRDVERFPSVEALKEQLQRDRTRALAVLAAARIDPSVSHA